MCIRDSVQTAYVRFKVQYEESRTQCGHYNLLLSSTRITLYRDVYKRQLLHISCTLYKKAMLSLHRLHSVYFAAQKREFYAKSTRVSSRRSSASICRMASRKMCIRDSVVAWLAALVVRFLAVAVL